MPRTPIDYSKTIIYKLVKNDDFNNENIYVGSTTDFTRRKNEHKNTCNNEKSKDYNDKKYQYIRENGGWSEWNMVEIFKDRYLPLQLATTNMRSHSSFQIVRKQEDRMKSEVVLDNNNVV